VFKGARVNNILSDENGKVIWALTDGGLMKVDVTTLSVESIPLILLKPSEIEVAAGLFKDRIGRLFIGVASGGILVLEKGGNFSRIHQDKLETHINGFCQTEDGQIWMVTQDQGVFVMDERNLELNRPKLNSGDEFSTNRFFSILKDSEDNVWIGSENEGLYVVYKNTGKLVHYKSDPSESHSLINTSVHSIYQDAFGRVWLGSFNQGVSYWDPYGIKFQTQRHRNEPQSLSSNAVSVFEEHPENGKVWVGTDGGGLNVWNKENTTFSSFQKGKTKGFTSNAILSLHQNSHKGLWIGTWGGGLMYKKEENDFFLGYEELGTKLNSNLPETPLHVFQIIPDENENLWLATFDRGLCHYDLKTNTITSYIESGEDKMASELAMCLAINKSKEIWVGTVTGLHKFTPKNDSTYSIKLYSQLQESDGKLPNNYIQTLYLDSKEQLWIGTAGGLCLYNPASDDFQTFTKKDGLPSNNIFSILEDEKGLLWVSCSRGLFTFNPENSQVNTFDIQDGIQDLSFSKNASIQLEDGQMLFGGVAGFNTFYPRNIKQNPTPPNLYFTDLKLFNKPVEISPESEILTTPLEYIDKLKLDYTQSVFTIDYVGLSLTHPEKNQYAYKLEGLEDEWNFVGNKTSATYTNLDGGTYTFMLKAANNDGLWTESPKELTIVISPPWWKMVWVQVGAILLLIVSSIAFYKMRVERLKRQKARLENTVKERTIELIEKQNEVEAQNEELQQQSDVLQERALELREKQNEVEAQNEELHQQSDTLKEQHDALESSFAEVKEKNKQITDSIRYAENIQQSILPRDKRLNELFNNHFIVYKPKDIVSGDFYWATEQGKYTFLAVIDCTGHGVPGAFMSMIGHTLLNRIVQEQDIYDTKVILNKLNIGISKSLRQKTSNNSDGMDMAIVRIETMEEGKYEVQFSGAKNNLYVFKASDNYKHSIIKGTRRSIGAIYNRGAEYDGVTLTLEKNDAFLLSSDGIIDLEIRKTKRLGTPAFMSLAENHINDFDSLQKELNNTIAESKEKFPPRDDIAIFGVKF
ncbi:MAG: ligand-binding sensor domain-containing protein, partial [Bacteroidia bacterium]